MTIKSIMLATAAGLLAVPAYAADLPGEVAPAAVDYVKVCDAFGAGFFYIPGTDTCLDISGRVRFRVAYNSASEDILFRADGRVDFDARTATEYGQLRSFFRIADSGASRVAVVDSAYIQLGYLTVGYAGDIFNGDRLYGINDQGIGFDDSLQITLFADDLGGGFFAGASLNMETGGGRNLLRHVVDDVEDLSFEAKAGITGQPWGGVDLALFYEPNAGTDGFAAKLTGELVLSEGLNARLSAAYYDGISTGFNPTGDDFIGLSGALSYAASAQATVYAGIAYDILDGDDHIGANVGVDYTITPGLVLTGELAYDEVGAADNIQAVVQLARTW